MRLMVAMSFWLMMKAAELLNKWIFWVNGPNLEFHINGLNGAAFIGVPWSPTTGQWYHVAVTRSGGDTYKFYVDGTQVGGDQTDSTVIPDANAPLTLGHAEALPSLNGFLDEVEIFNRALTLDEITAIYIAGSAGKCKCTPPPANMISWWPGEGDGNDIQGGNTVTVSGSGVC